jgi:hypothetical protein
MDSGEFNFTNGALPVPVFGGGVLTHNGDTIGRGTNKGKGNFQTIFSGGNWNYSN